MPNSSPGVVSVGFEIDYRKTVDGLVSAFNDAVQDIKNQGIDLEVNSDVKKQVDEIRNELDSLKADASKKDIKLDKLEVRLLEVEAKTRELSEDLQNLGAKIDLKGFDTSMAQMRRTLNGVKRDFLGITGIDPKVLSKGTRALQRQADEASNLSDTISQLRGSLEDGILPEGFKTANNKSLEKLQGSISKVIERFRSTYEATSEDRPDTELTLLEGKATRDALILENLRTNVKALGGDLSSIKGYYGDLVDDINDVLSRNSLIETSLENISTSYLKAASEETKATDKLIEDLKKETSEITAEAFSVKDGKIVIPVEFASTSKDLQIKFSSMLDDIRKLIVPLEVPVYLVSNEDAKTQKGAANVIKNMTTKLFGAKGQTAEVKDILSGLTEANSKAVVTLATKAYNYAKAQVASLKEYTDGNPLNIKLEVTDEEKEKLQQQLEAVAGDATKSFGVAVKKLYSTKDINTWGNEYIKKLKELEEEVNKIAPSFKEKLYITPPSTANSEASKGPIDDSSYTRFQNLINNINSSLSTLSNNVSSVGNVLNDFIIPAAVSEDWEDFRELIDHTNEAFDALKEVRDNINQYIPDVSNATDVAQQNNAAGNSGLTRLQNYELTERPFNSLNRFGEAITRVGTIAEGLLRGNQGALFRLAHYVILVKPAFDSLRDFQKEIRNVGAAAELVLRDDKNTGLKALREYTIPTDNLKSFIDYFDEITKKATSVLNDENGLLGIKNFNFTANDENSGVNGFIQQINRISDAANAILRPESGLGLLKNYFISQEAFKSVIDFNQKIADLDSTARQVLTSSDGLYAIKNFKIAETNIQDFINSLDTINTKAKGILEDQSGLGGIKNFNFGDVTSGVDGFVKQINRINEAATAILNPDGGLGQLKYYYISKEAIGSLIEFKQKIADIDSTARQVLTAGDGLYAIKNFKLEEVNVQSFINSLNAINTRASEILGDQSGLGGLRAFAFGSEIIASSDDVKNHLDGLKSTLDAIGNNNPTLEYLKNYVIPNENIESIKNFKDGIRAINSALTTGGGEKKLKEFASFTGAIMALSKELKDFKSSFSPDMFSFEIPKNLVGEMTAFKDAVKEASEAIRAFPGDDNFAKNLKSIASSLKTIPGNMKQLGSNKSLNAFEALNHLRIQKNASSYLDKFKTSLQQLMDYMQKDMPKDATNILNKISDMLGKKEQLKDLATILKATSKQVKSAEEMLAGEKAKENQKNADDSYKIIINDLKEIKKLQDTIIKAKAGDDLSYEKKKIEYLEKEREKQNDILKGTGLKNNAKESELYGLLFDIDDQKEKLAHKDNVEKAYKEVNDLLKERLDLEKEISELASKLLDQDTTEEERRNVEKEIAAKQAEANSKKKEIESKREAIKQNNLLTESYEKQLDKIEALIKGTTLNADSKLGLDEVLIKDSQAWQNAIKVLDEYKERIGEIQSITRQLRRDPSDPTNYFVSYFAKGSNGAVDVGLNGELLIQKDNVALVEEEYKNLEKATRNYASAAKQILAGTDLASNFAKLKNALKEIQRSKSELSVYADQEWTSQKKVNEAYKAFLNVQSDIGTRIEQEKAKYDDLIVSLSNVSGKTDLYKEKLQELKNLINQRKDILDKGVLVTDEDISKVDKLESQISDLKKLLSSTKLDIFNTKRGTLTSFTNADDIVKATEAMDGVYKQSVKWQRQGQNVIIEYKKMNGEAVKQKYIWDENAKAYGTFGEVVKGSSNFFERLNTDLATSVKRFQSYFSGYMLIRRVVDGFRQGIEVIKEIDKQFVEMRKVSKETVTSLREYVNVSFDVAKAIGSTSTSILSSTADYMRLGKSLQDAAELAKNTTILMNVSEFQDINEATEAMISLTQAYQELDSMEIIDKLNNIGKYVA